MTVGAAPLPAGPLPDQAAQVQVFAGQEPEAEIRIDQPHTVRSVQFAKAAPDTRLRITYRDRAVTAGSANPFTATMVLRIDGTHLPLLDTVFDASGGSLDGFPIYAVSAPFTTVGWVTGIGAGTHVLDTAYVVAGGNPPIVGFISGSPFLIEVAELP
jgi:hypothetical protein